MTPRAWTADEVRNLGTVTDVETAGSILGLTRSASYDALRRGDFPVPTFRVGRKIRVPVQPLLDLLGLAGEPADEDREARRAEVAKMRAEVLG